MASVRYYDEHLAWIQRIGKEQWVASRGITHRKLETSPIIRRRQSPESVIKKKKPKTTAAHFPRPSFTQQTFYEEVRGKYARLPLFANNKPSVIPGLVATPQNEEVVFSRRQTRAVSSESTRRKRYRQRPYLRMSLDTQLNESLDKKEQSRPATSSHLSVGQISLNSKNKAPTEADTHEADENVEEHLSVVEEGEEQDPELPPNAQEDDNESVASCTTRSSQLRYIEELEKLLQYERMKRIKLEQQLNKIYNT